VYIRRSLATTPSVVGSHLPPLGPSAANAIRPASDPSHGWPQYPLGSNLCFLHTFITLHTDPNTMYTPAGPSGALPPRPGSAAEDDRIAAFKQSTNFRSVTRNDPSVVEILDTSVYSVIYLYDEAAGAWEKQKQEGPLFIVRR
jgi:hypothetical protein